MGKTFARYTEDGDASVLTAYPEATRRRISQLQNNVFLGFPAAEEYHFFVTSKGYFGKTVATPEVGDEVWVF